jgi:D-lactate dehydrogenase (cytochrome)
MIANNAAGPRAYLYGSTGDNLLALRVVLADGSIISTGCRSPKTSSGYNLLRLFAGSEGTLGIVTEATLRLRELPDAVATVYGSFPDDEAAVRACMFLRSVPLRLSAIEHLDQSFVGMILDGGARLDLPRSSAAFTEIEGDRDNIEKSIELVVEGFRRLGAMAMITAQGSAVAEHWAARHKAFEFAKAAERGARWMVLDVGVPPSHYGKALVAARSALKSESCSGFCLGHAGDGNLHVTLPMRSEEDAARCNRVNDFVVRAALELGGTATAEHGVGIGKIGYMRNEHANGMDVMLAIKRAFDPLGILNPGKIFASSDRGA